MDTKNVYTIEVNTSAPYRVLVGAGLLKDTGVLTAECVPGAETAVIVTDDTVNALHGDCCEESLRAAGFRVIRYVFPHGEASKTAANYVALLEFLAEQQVTRSDVIIALGGGVIGDMAGFAAATYLRKIAFVQIPTSLLAAVDSSVGGKTAVDLAAGKNMMGAFHQPRLVVCDTALLDTLPEDTYRDGCAEVIKYGVLWDRPLFSHLQEQGIQFDRAYVIPRCIELKRDVVVKDEFDNGLRQLLNLGHTLAHAAEKISHYELTHGKAVAAGMACMARAAAAAGMGSKKCAEEIEEILRKFGLPVSFRELESSGHPEGTSEPAEKLKYDPEALFAAMQSDKKRKGLRISIIVPEEIGQCRILKLSMEELREFVEPGL